MDLRDQALLALSQYLNSRQLAQIRGRGVKLRAGKVVIVFQDRMALVLDGDDALAVSKLKQSSRSPSGRLLNLNTPSAVRSRLCRLRKAS